MKVSIVDEILWAAGFVGHAALFLILLFRSRVRAFPVFSAYVLFQIVATIVLFVDYRILSGSRYALLYWSGAILDFCLLTAVLAEVALRLLRPSRRWVEGSVGTMLSLSILGVVIAAALTFLVHPWHEHSAIVWQLRGNLFTSIVTCELFTVVLLTSQRFGVYWRSHLMGLGIGLTIWALTAFVVDGLHAMMGGAAHYNGLEDARKIVYISTLVFWISAFWRDEPQMLRMPPEMRNRILQEADRVSYDLAKVLPAREKEISS